MRAMPARERSSLVSRAMYSAALIALPATSPTAIARWLLSCQMKS